MPHLLRISLLTTCLAMGIAVAVAVALRKPPIEEASGQTIVSAAADEPASTAAIQVTPTSTAAEPIFQPLGPVVAPYRDLVAQQAEPPPAAEAAAQPPVAAEAAAQPPSAQPASEPAAAQPPAVTPAVEETPP